MNCPCGVHVPEDNQHCLCIPQYFVKSINRIHKTYKYIYCQVLASLLANICIITCPMANNNGHSQRDRSHRASDAKAYR